MGAPDSLFFFPLVKKIIGVIIIYYYWGTSLPHYWGSGTKMLKSTALEEGAGLRGGKCEVVGKSDTVSQRNPGEGREGVRCKGRRRGKEKMGEQNGREKFWSFRLSLGMAVA